MHWAHKVCVLVWEQGRNCQIRGPRPHLWGKETQESGRQDRAPLQIWATGLRNFPGGGGVGGGSCRPVGQPQTGKGDRTLHAKGW